MIEAVDRSLAADGARVDVGADTGSDVGGAARTRTDDPAPGPCVQASTPTRVSRCLRAALLAGGAVAALGLYALGRGRLAADGVVEVPIRGLPVALDGLRIGHLSDFHLGALFSRGNRASERCRGWVARAADPISYASRATSSRIPGASDASGDSSQVSTDPFVVLGNHDVAVTRDPFSRVAELRDLERARCFADEAGPSSFGARVRSRRRRRPRELSQPSRTARRARR